MIPEATYSPEILQAAQVVIQPSLGWRIDFLKKRIIGNIDETESVRQAVYMILSTERYTKPIYTWNYGIETYDLYQSNKSYIIPQLQSRIMDALCQDDRIIEVSNFKFDLKGGVYHVAFDVRTVFDTTITAETEVAL